MVRRDDLLRLTGTRPQESDGSQRTIVVVLQDDGVLLEGRERDRPGPFSLRLVDPLVDDRLTVDPQSHAVVRDRVKRVGL